MLKRLSETKLLWVEAGLQTIQEDTARLINRCHELPVYEQAVNYLQELGATASPT